MLEIQQPGDNSTAQQGPAGNRESWFGETVKMVERVGKGHPHSIATI